MTEEQWLGCENSDVMLDFVRPQATKRKLRLFAAACFRRLSHLLPDIHQRQAIDLLEDTREDDLLPRGIVNRVRVAIPSGKESFDGKYRGSDDPYYVALMLYRELVSSSTAHHAAVARRGLAEPAEEEEREQCRLLRCIFGPLPFRCILVDSAWRASHVVELADQIYRDKAFEKMPMLADALEKAGCKDVDVRNHCHQTGHVRGCWVVDLLLEQG